MSKENWLNLTTNEKPTHGVGHLAYWRSHLRGVHDVLSTCHMPSRRIVALE